MDKTAVCARCGIEFTKKKACQRFCSPKCAYDQRVEERVKEYDAVKKARTMTKTCLFCGKEFDTSYKQDIFCSQKCEDDKRWKDVSEEWANKKPRIVNRGSFNY